MAVSTVMAQTNQPDLYRSAILNPYPRSQDKCLEKFVNINLRSNPELDKYIETLPESIPEVESDGDREQELEGEEDWRSNLEILDHAQH